MISILNIVKSGFNLTGDKFKLFAVVFFSTLFLINIIEYIFSKVNQQNQVLYLLLVLLIENFLTCSIYGSLKKTLFGTRLTLDMFISSGFIFFLRFLFIKIVFIFFVIILAGLFTLVVKATSGISIPAATAIVVLWLIWFAFPTYYFVLSLFAPIVLFSENSGIIHSIKTAIIFSKKNLDKIIILSFFYFSAIALLVYLPERVYNNIQSVVWITYKGIVVSIFEIGFISSLILLYQKEINHEGNV
ncbi:MAG: hypothetical protein N2115_06690 [bacterium]|nr:hypothetical protein [bacterium]